MNRRLLLPSMSLLAAYEAAARHLSFTRAADELSLTQSAVSRQVQALETLLGVQLIRREGRQIFLTDLGAVYQREVHAALNRIQNASLQVIAYRSGVGSFHLAALPTFAAKWLMPRLGEFYIQHPGTLVHVHARIGQFDLQQAGMDAVISVGDGAWPGLVAHHLVDEILLPVISPALARSHQVKKAADLVPLLLLQVASRAYAWRQWFVAQGLSPHAMRVGPHFEFTSHLIQAVAAGIGIGLVPGLLVQDELRSGVLQLALDLPLVTGFGYYLFVPPDKLSLPPIAAFKNWLLDINMKDSIEPQLGKPLV